MFWTLPLQRLAMTVMTLAWWEESLPNWVTSDKYKHGSAFCKLDFKPYCCSREETALTLKTLQSLISYKISAPLCWVSPQGPGSEGHLAGKGVPGDEQWVLLSLCPRYNPDLLFLGVVITESSVLAKVKRVCWDQSRLGCSVFHRLMFTSRSGIAHVLAGIFVGEFKQART